MMIEFERRHQKLASPEVYHKRLDPLGSHSALFMVVISLVVGMAGYSYFEHLGFVDAFQNAAMILSGMGPVDSPKSTGGKLFAGLYALYSGFAVLVIAAVMFAPAIHRVLHRFHIQDDPKKSLGRHALRAAAGGCCCWRCAAPWASRSPASHTSGAPPRPWGTR